MFHDIYLEKSIKLPALPPGLPYRRLMADEKIEFGDFIKIGEYFYSVTESFNPMGIKGFTADCEYWRDSSRDEYFRAQQQKKLDTLSTDLMLLSNRNTFLERNRGKLLSSDYTKQKIERIHDLDPSGFVYLAIERGSTGYYKIGKTNKPFRDNRKNAFNTHSPRGVRLIWEQKVENRHKAESYLLTRYDAHRARLEGGKEWFMFTPSIVRQIKRTDFSSLASQLWKSD